MQILDLKENNRIQVDVERNINNAPLIETHRGIVMDISPSFIILVSNYGENIYIRKEDIISISRCSFDMGISKSMLKLKTHYREKKELLARLETLKAKEPKLIDNLLNANMLSRFNILGAKNRMLKSIDDELLDFTRGQIGRASCRERV